MHFSPSDNCDRPKKQNVLVFVHTHSIIPEKKKSFKMVELMDRRVASVAVCPVFIVHFKLHFGKILIFRVAWTLLFYSVC